MFVAWRDLRHARGRFALMTSVIALITLLVTLLAALTAGLGRASTSAVVDLPADRLAFAAPEAGAGPSFTQSQVTEKQWKAWSEVAGVSWAQPLGLAQTRATSNGADGTTASVTALGVLPGSPLLPQDDGAGGLSDGTVVLSPGAADALAARRGDTVTVGASALTVVAVSSQDSDFAHTPTVWTTLDDWQAVGAHPTAGGAGDGALVATVVTLGLEPGTTPGVLTAADASIGTTTLTLSGARSAISSYAAEHLSLTMMQGFLLVISALVVGVFFTVWTINRGRDIAVIKALGGSTGYLLRDAIGQATVVLVLGTTIGAGLATGIGLLAATVMPVVVGASTIMLPAVLLTVLGLVGATVAIARIASIDPHSALAAR